MVCERVDVFWNRVGCDALLGELTGLTPGGLQRLDNWGMDV